MMESIASMAMSMSAASFATNYSLAVTKKMMDSQELAGQELKELGVADSQELGFYVLCVVKKPVADSTVNLKCPVAINPETRVARQVILEADAYEMRHPLDQFGSKEEGAPC